MLDFLIDLINNYKGKKLCVFKMIFVGIPLSRKREHKHFLPYYREIKPYLILTLNRDV
jgi:hypothetical protein